jgi:hypothetical protein
VERYRQQLEKAREQPEAILVLEVTTGFVTEEIGESHQISSDFMVGCIIFHHFPNEWPLFFGRYTQFSDKPTWEWIGGCPHPRSEDRIWGSFYIMP